MSNKIREKKQQQTKTLQKIKTNLCILHQTLNDFNFLTIRYNL